MMVAVCSRYALADNRLVDMKIFNVLRYDTPFSSSNRFLFASFPRAECTHRGRLCAARVAEEYGCQTFSLDFQLQFLLGQISLLSCNWKI